MTCAPGTRLGPYEIRSARDLPGLGDVYDARDHAQRRDVAIRILRTDFGANPERLRRFEQDTRAAAALTHPNILTVHNIGTDAGAAYIVSEPLEGATLRESLNGGVLPVSSVIQYALQIAHGLAAAHGKGVVHGDLTPENILIAPDGRLKILGFGLAAVTHSESALTALRGPSAGVALGTLSYMSPEQVRGMAADDRSDIFTFGAILYETLSGARAFSRDNPVDTMTAILQPEPPELAADRDIPPVLLRVVDACLEKDPAARVATAAEIASVLHTLWSQRTPVAAAAADAGAPMRRLRVASWIVAVIGLVALAAAVTPATMRIVESVWLGTLVRLSPAAPPSSSPPTSPRPTSPLPSSTPPTSTPPPSTSTPPPAAEPAPPPRPTPPRSTTPAPPGLTPPTSRPPAPTPPRRARSAAPRPASRPQAFPPPEPARSAASPPAPSASGPPVFPPPASTPSIPPSVAAGPQDSHLVWFGRAGAELGRVGEPADYGDVSLSPDGMRVAVSVRARGSDAADIWVVDLASEMRTRLTSDPADDIAPVWSPDGRRILFASSRKGSYDLYEAEVGGTGNETVIIDAPGDQIAYDWSSNGRYLVYQTTQPRVIAGGNLDLWMRAWPAGRPFAFLRTVHAASRATFSPDGTRVAYTSFEGGREDVYVAAFPRYDGRRRISAGGGSWSRWRRDGSEIFYLDPENRLVAVPVKRTASGVDAGSGRPLFATGARPDRGYAYDVSADGDRILVNTPR